MLAQVIWSWVAASGFEVVAKSSVSGGAVSGFGVMVKCWGAPFGFRVMVKVFWFWGAGSSLLVLGCYFRFGGDGQSLLGLGCCFLALG